MPRRNLLILIVVALVAAFCVMRVQPNPYLNVLAEAMSTVENRALEARDDRQLFEGAMAGMIGQLDDEYSSYIPESQLNNFHEELDGQFGGVGILIGTEAGSKNLAVLSPLAGSPAARAGILAGDRILKIDDASTEGMPLDDAKRRLRGLPGSVVSLTLQRTGEKEPRTVALTREIINEDTVLGDTRNADGTWNYFLEGHDRIGYIRVTSFTDGTIIEIRDALAKLSAGGMRGLILDLRENPGGYLDAAVDMCDLFVRSGVIVSTKRREGNRVRTITASGAAPDADLPIVVLVNGNTASAAEIVAACLQDNDRAKVVGSRSYGKGTVQDIIELPNGYGAMKITTSSYWRPNGRNIHRRHDAKETDVWGVSPDKSCEVTVPDDQYERWAVWRTHRDVYQPPKAASPTSEKPFVDRVLLRAVECLK